MMQGSDAVATQQYIDAFNAQHNRTTISQLIHDHPQALKIAQWALVAFAVVAPTGCDCIIHLRNHSSSYRSCCLIGSIWNLVFHALCDMR